jgi:hypothetical protein
VSKAVLDQKRTILSQPLWKIGPWEANPSSKQPVDFLLDFVSDVACHLEDMKTIAGKNSVQQRRELADRAVATMIDFNDWWRRWSQLKPQSCWEIESDPNFALMADLDGPLYPTMLHYTDLGTAYTVCTYICGRILILHVLRSLALDTPEQGDNLFPTHGDPKYAIFDEDNDTPLLGITSDATALAQELLRSFDFCYHGTGGFMGTFCILTVLHEDYGAVKSGSREANWLRIVTNGA